MTTLTRTSTGFQTDKAAIIQGDLSNQEAQIAFWLIVDAKTCKEAAKLLGITLNTAKKTVQRLLWRLRVNSIREAARELHKRELIKYLCLMALANAGMIPPTEANTTYHRPPPRIARLPRPSRRERLTLENEGLSMPTVSLHAAQIRKKERLRQKIAAAIKEQQPKITIIEFGKSTETEREIARIKKREKANALKERQQRGWNIIFRGHDND